MTFKQKIYSLFLELINERVRLHKETLISLRQSAANETKSTAGDKHETALAMLQIEQENTGRQLNEAIKQKELFKKIDPLVKNTGIANGSLVKTNKGCFFVSVALGKIAAEGFTITALSLHSPLGTKMKGRKTGETIEMNGMLYTIESID